MIIREAVMTDTEGIAKVHIDSWKTTYKHIVSESYLNKRSYEQKIKQWNDTLSLRNNYVYVAINDKEEVIGFTSGIKETEGKYVGYDGEVTTIYILEEYHGKGIGKQLLQVLFQRFKSENIHSSIVKVLERNESRYFYERLGAKLLEDKESVTIGDDKMKMMVYGWRL